MAAPFEAEEFVKWLSSMKKFLLMLEVPDEPEVPVDGDLQPLPQEEMVEQDDRPVFKLMELDGETPNDARMDMLNNLLNDVNGLLRKKKRRRMGPREASHRGSNLQSEVYPGIESMGGVDL
ncbi:MAG: hypothetical protein CME70_18275 [Halobacteriovorax sp.]|nr:hypothetical protein [Halobacteriovorax sp.]|tara:strand:- start:1389 stop:1751 length:363 start_codon:yes stop_codon:yes gene_type:complete